MNNDSSGGPGFTLGEAVHADAPTIARIHTKAFPGFFLTSLGPAFLVRFYGAYIADPETVSIVARSDDGGKVVGVVVGAVDPGEFYRRLLIRKGFSLALISARAALRNPRIVRRLVRGLFYRGGSPAAELPEAALLASIAVDPDMQGTGLGSELVQAWCRQMESLGVRRGYLTTDAVGNDSVNRFYERCGWELLDSYRTSEGRLMNRYYWSSTLGRAA